MAAVLAIELNPFEFLTRNTMHKKIFGLWLSSQTGNCFAPALQLTQGSRAGFKWRLTIRDHKWMETQIYFRNNGSSDWCSDHIAVWFGKLYPGDEECGIPTIWEYQGFLGHHQRVI
jgi:hypothetical protein